MSSLLAIDPGSKKLGIAFVENGKLIGTRTITTTFGDPLARRIDMAKQVEGLCIDRTVVSEEPLLLGRNNNGMQRLLGMFELIKPSIHYVHPMTVKKAMGSGSLDKLEVALAAGEKLKTDGEKEIVADAIAREAWDETDAVAVGLTYLERSGNNAH